MQPLTERELYIYKLMEKGDYTSRELGEILGISHTGIQKIYKRAKAKIGVKTTTKKH